MVMTTLANCAYFKSKRLAGARRDGQANTGQKLHNAIRSSERYIVMLSNSAIIILSASSPQVFNKLGLLTLHDSPVREASEVES